MRILRWAIGILATALLALGLVLGFVPQWHEFSDEDYGSDEVACGSPFLPANSTDAADELSQADYWIGSSDAYAEADRAEACETVLGDDRAGGISYVALGLLGFAYLGWLRWSGKRSEAAACEARWRAQGYVPESELRGPPPGWRRATDAPVAPPVEWSAP